MIRECDRWENKMMRNNTGVFSKTQVLYLALGVYVLWVIAT
jgi:hypothetical protein